MNVKDNKIVERNEIINELTQLRNQQSTTGDDLLGVNTSSRTEERIQELETRLKEVEHRISEIEASINGQYITSDTADF